MTAFEEGLKEKVSSLLQEHYLKGIKSQVGSEVDKMNQIVAAVNTFCCLPPNERDLHIRLAHYKSQLGTFIEEMWQSPEEKNFSELYETTNDVFYKLFEDVAYSKQREQLKERFYTQPEDSLVLKILKFGKRTLFHISKTPLYLANKLGGKSYKVHYWKHKVLVRNLSKYHFQGQLILDLKEVTDLFFTSICGLYLDIKHWEEELINADSREEKSSSGDIDTQIKKFKSSLIRKIKGKIDDILSQRLLAFNEDYVKAGTIEFPGNQLTDAEINREIERAERSWARNNREWKNTIYALFEEWRSDLDIFTLKHKTRAAFEDFQSAQIRKVADQIDPELESLQQFIKESEEALKGSSSDEFSKNLKKISYQADKKLDKELLPRLSEKLTSQNIANIINKLELDIRQQVEELSDEHVIVKTSTYDYRIKTDDLKKISPYELIAFEALTIFQEEIEGVKKALFSTLESTNSEISDVGGIISFSADSAVSAIEEEDKTQEEALSIVLEGLNRASSRLTDKRSELEESINANTEKLDGVIDAFCERLMELTVNENVGELRLRITKAKAAKQAEEIKEEIREKVRSRRRLAINVLKGTYTKTRTFITNISERFVLTASKPAITRQVSDFLLESQLAINNLPLIYRRLYRIEPLEDMELFEGRIEETRLLDEAFQSWNQGRYAGTAILGEKWGGLTTFLNHTVHNAKFPIQITRFAAKQNICDDAGLILLMRDIFKNQTFENLDQVVDHLNSGAKRIVILEDLQNLYLRKVGGFTALQSLFQLITRTYNNVFWITSTTIYTWHYLSKAIHINEFFSYVIEMGTLTEEQIVNIIWKRNRISGYNIRFELSEVQEADKKFQKLTDSEQQQLLKDEYFAALNEFARSNVSLALIFWLLSTRKVDENTITIGSFKKPDLNFISVLSMDKVYTLHALILHDGLTEWQLKEVLNLTESGARLNLLALLEDGIVTKKGDVYFVNPMVYRNTIAILKAKNLIH